MILSNRYKFIFIKTTKTAGTSLEIALSKFCDSNDIITPITSQDELLRKELGGQMPVNFHASLSEYKLIDWWKFLRYRRLKKRFYNHIGGRQIRDNLPTYIWNEYFKFAVFRSPLSRSLSHFYWLLPEGNYDDFRSYVQTGRPKDLLKNSLDAVRDESGDLLVDQIFRYEEMENMRHQLVAKLGLPGELNLPYTKNSSRKKRNKRLQVSDIHSNERNEIMRIFAPELEFLQLHGF